MNNSIEKAVEQLNKPHSTNDSVRRIQEDIGGNDSEKTVNTDHDIESNINSTHIEADQSKNHATFVSSDTLTGKELVVPSNRMGEILIAQGKLSTADVTKIIQYQTKKGLYFGEAALKLKLVSKNDILTALSVQFGYTYERTAAGLSKEIVMASSPFSPVAEEFRSIRSQLISNWHGPDHKTLAIFSPEGKEGRSYVSANLATAFSQLGRPTLLIDANMRTPRQHEIFKFPNRVGLSMLLAERVTLSDLHGLPYKIPGFNHLSVLGCSAIPPNPSELLCKDTFYLILRRLEKKFHFIIIDTPSATFQADVLSIASAAGSALLVVKSGQSKVEGAKDLLSILNQAGTYIAGSILNQY